MHNPSSRHGQLVAWSERFKQPPRKPGFFIYFCLILGTLIAFAPMLGSDLLWTPYDSVERSPYQSMESWTEVLSGDSLRSQDPLSLLSNFAEAALPLPTPALHRSINILLHLGAVLILLQLLTLLRAPGRVLASTAFAFHPAVVQTLFWPGYRTEILALVLILSCLFFGLRNRSSKDYIAALLLAVLASLLHPAALCLPVLLGLGILYQVRHPHMSDFNRVLPFLGLATFIGVWTLGGSTGTAAAPLPEGLSQLNLAGENMFFFIRQSFMPLILGLFHPYTEGSQYQVGAQMSLLPFCIFIPLYIVIGMNFRKLWSRSLLFGLTAFLLLSIYGATQAGYYLDGSLAHEEHSLYIVLPIALSLLICHLAGFVRFIAQPLKPLWAVGISIALICLFVLTASYSYAIGDQVRMWQSIELLWPESWIPKAALIDFESERGTELYTADERMVRLEEILEARPEQHERRLMLARIYAEKGQDTNANREYKRLLREAEPDNALLEEAATFFDSVGLTWDANNARARIQPQP
ncbi:type IV pilus assembly protein FimV [Coraliomargarita parva]|uniref:type IV pilus assembly protein FimV n=1 Tax=Coraliomargarita parva TaxID=3014050 RepID=UPI0022B2F939|nr:hypothetical protein [Coraliomargarita parva]